MESKLLLLDEPLSNLDAKLRVQMRRELKELQKRLNLTMLYVTHDQIEAFYLSDKITIMFNGKISAQDSPINFYKSPMNDEVARFLGHVNRLPAKVKTHMNGDNKGTVETPIGNINCIIPENVVEGDDFILYLRPSYISLYSKKPNDSINVIQGEITDVAYLGSDYVEYFININGYEIRIRSKPSSDLDITKTVYLKIESTGSVGIKE